MVHLIWLLFGGTGDHTRLSGVNLRAKSGIAGATESIGNMGHSQGLKRISGGQLCVWAVTVQLKGFLLWAPN